MKPPIGTTFLCFCLVSLLALPSAANAYWFTQQGGKTSGNVCYEPPPPDGNGMQFTTMTGGQAYRLIADNACGYMYCTGSSDTANWNYNVTGAVTVANTTGSTETLTVTGNYGVTCAQGGTWPNETFTNCTNVTLYSGNITGKETKIVPFSITDPGLIYTDFDDFYVSVKLSGPGTCIGGAYVTWEHD